MNKFWKVFLTVIGVVLIIALLAALTLWIISFTKDMTFVEYLKSIFSKPQTTKANLLQMIPYSPIKIV